MHVLVTRPESDAEDLSARLEALGVKVSTAALIEIAFETIPAGTLIKATGLIVTSRNGLRALARSGALTEARAKPLFAVSTATADLARDLGFTDVRVGPGTASGLVPVILAASADLGDGPLIHLAGDHLAFDLKGTLADNAVDVTLVLAYRSIAASALPGDIQKALAAGALDAIILMSPRTARLWGQLAAAAGLEKNSRNLTYVCLSSAVAEAGQLPRQAKIVTADTPSSLEIVALIGRLAASIRKE